MTVFNPQPAADDLGYAVGLTEQFQRLRSAVCREWRRATWWDRSMLPYSFLLHAASEKMTEYKYWRGGSPMHTGEARALHITFRRVHKYFLPGSQRR